LGAPLTQPPEHQTLVAPKPRPPASKVDDIILVLASDPYNARLYHDLLDQHDYSSFIEQNYNRWPNAVSLCTPSIILMDLSYYSHPSVDIAWRLIGDPKFRSIPTLAITDQRENPQPSDTRTIIDNCDGRITKPVSVSGFLQPIEELLDRSRANRPAQTV
jgi:CheY-like chemotaxis protein